MVAQIGSLTRRLNLLIQMNIPHPSAALDNSHHLEMIPIHHRLHATVRVPPVTDQPCLADRVTATHHANQRALSDDRFTLPGHCKQDLVSTLMKPTTK